ncbi:MAG: hypothetical protein J7J38_00745 [Candidatus Aenigmarchaeota archaeon]|nr:hypothetical protein [Candidatus Aenigmarchaeota archaeon]
MKKNNGAKMIEKKIEDIKEELEMLDDTLSALVDLLIEKGIITDEEWEEKVKEKSEENKKLNELE